MKILVILVLALPLLGSLHHVLCGRFAPRRRVEGIACGAVLLPLAAAAALLIPGWPESLALSLLPWISSGDFSASFDVLLDPLSLIVTLMVCFISLCIHVYSVFFMRLDEGYVRYYFFLNLFVFCMLVITLADNLVFLFLGWEGVGLCSYALIGYWFTDTKRVLAGSKAFIMTRIGDVAFLVALALFFEHFNTFSVASIASRVDLLSPASASLLGFLLLWAALGKSAQLPLQVWLPDAMFGPTPVSALIHAATMVTAGVYLLLRLYPVLALSQTALLTVALLGACTALFASCSALAQRELKRILAWSTIGQVGFMFVAIGAGNLPGALFHLLTHAFFKALLFLGAGCIIQALHEEHEIYRMGAWVRKAQPQVFWAFLFGALALGGVPPFSGFFSKGEILVSTLHHSSLGFRLVWLLALAASLFTVLYTFRMVFLVFFGEPPEGEPARIEPIPVPMVRVLWPLAVLSLVAGVLHLPGSTPWSGWLGNALASVSTPLHHLKSDTAWLHLGLETGIGLVGIGIAFAFYGPGDRIGRRRPAASGVGIQGLLLDGFQVDRLYQAALVRPYQSLAGWLWRDVDQGVVDGAAEWTGRLMALASSGVRLWSTGRISTYLSMLLGGLVFILLVLLAAGAWHHVL